MKRIILAGIWLLCLASALWGQGISLQGDVFYPTTFTGNKCDSAVMMFGDTIGNLTDTVLLLPVNQDSTYLRGSHALNDAGDYTLEILGYFTSGDTIRAFGTWHVSPDSVAIGRAPWNDDIIARADRRIGVCDSTGKIGSTDLEFTAPADLYAKLDSIMDYVGMGEGPYPCSLYVMNVADSSAIAGVKVRVLNQAQNARAAWGWTDDNGLYVCGLNAEIYKLWIYRMGITAPQSDSIIMTSGGLNDTIYATVWSPSMLATVNVWGVIRSMDGEPVPGAKLAFHLRDSTGSPVYNVRLKSDSSIVHIAYAEAEADANGQFGIWLFPNAGLDPDNTFYEVVVQKDRVISTKRARFQVPADTTEWKLEIL